MYSAEQVSNWFLAWNEINPRDIKKIGPFSNMCLQKMLYFSQSHYLAEKGIALFEEELEAWKDGPAVYNIYTKFSGKGKSGIELTDDFDFGTFSEEDNHFLIKIWNTYGSLPAAHLRNKSHKELPWLYFWDEETKKGEVIPKHFMENYYLIREVAA